MTSKISLSGIMLAVICLCASCLSNDTETVTYEDTAVTAFTLGTVRCYRTVKTSAGNDSTYSYTYSASTLPYYIDQVNRRIYNEDSLVVGTDVSRVLTTITTKNNGVAILKNIDDDQWTAYSSSDSIDFSKARTLRVLSSDGLHHTDYTVDIRCHKEYADSFSWKRMPYNAKIATFTKMKAVQANAVVYLMGTDMANNVSLLRSTDGSEWTECTTPPTVGMASASMASVDGTLMIYAGEKIHSSTDGNTWTSVIPNTILKTLVGGGNGEIYAIGSTGTIMVSKDNGATWVQDDMESDIYVDNSKYLPASDVSIITADTKTNSGITRATMVGNKNYTGADDTFSTAVVWNKVVDKTVPQVWTYTNVAWNNHNYTLPRMEGITAISYADGILAIGGTPVNNSAAAYSTLYYSPDWGATWHTQTSMNVPAGFATSKVAAMVADGKGCFLLIGVNPDATEADGKCIVWRGKQNKLLWDTSIKYYE